MFQYIKDQSSLIKLVEQYHRSDVLVLDTEFVRTRTYYAQLGLIQAYDGQTLALIDPLEIQDLSCFWELVKRDDMTTVIHASSEDLEVIAKYGNCQPKRLFDSQIAASLAGFGYGLGYARLVEQCLDIKIDKDETRTNWCKRPLTTAQLHYAVNDVKYLYQVYGQLLAKLKDLDRLDWVYQEGQRMTDGRLDSPDIDRAYLKVKKASQLNAKQLGYLKVLAKWRLEQALQKDLVLGFVIKDEVLIALAKNPPQGIGDILKMAALSESEKHRYAKVILAVMATADLNNPPQEIENITLSTNYKSAFKAIKNSLTPIAMQWQVPMEVLASKRYINEYLRWLWKGEKTTKPLLLCGWRAGLIQSKLEQIKTELT